MATRTRLLAPLLALVSGGCISGGYYRAQAFEPVKQVQFAALPPGVATLDDALRTLGAPVYVWEWKQDGIALAWGWRNLARWGFSVSVPLTHNDSASFSYDRLSNDLPGAVLFFDRDDKLVEARQGLLADIRTETARARPAAPEEEGP